MRDVTTADFALERLLVGLALSIVVSLGGWFAKALTKDGAIAAVVVGSVIFASLSWPGAIVLGTFFLSSSILSKLSHSNEIAAKGSRRDRKQVLANGGIPAATALLAFLTYEFVIFAMVAGAFAAATADTWATEIGSKSRRPPRFILSREIAFPGESGAVTALGTGSGAVGAAFIGAVASVCGLIEFGSREAALLMIVVPIAGFAGMVADSVLGELVQRKRRCPICDLPSESFVHHCGAETIHAGGVGWIDNDFVNRACTVVGATIGWSVYLGWTCVSR